MDSVTVLQMDTVRSNEMQRVVESWFRSEVSQCTSTYRYSDAIILLHVAAQLVQKRLASLVLGLWVEVEGQNFEKRLSLFLPLLYEGISLYDPEAPGGLGMIEKMAEQEDKEDSKGEGGMEEDGNGDTRTENGESGMEVEPPEADSQAATVQLLDQLLFSILSTLRKICSVCPVLRGSTHCELMNQIWGEFNNILASLL